MRKIVINKCYGGFGLSEEAIILARKIDPNCWAKDIVLDGETYNSGEVADNFWEHYYSDFSRHDPILVKVVEELGSSASGEFAKLVIEEVEDLYRVIEHDGKEWIETPDNIDWE